MGTRLPKNLQWAFANKKQKPFGQFEIDWDNPITKGLVLYVDYGRAGRGADENPSFAAEADVLWDLVGVEKAIKFGGSAGIIRTVEGIGYYNGTSTSTGGVTAKTNWKNVFSGQEATYLARLRRVGTGSNALSDFDTTSQTAYPFGGVLYCGIFRANRITMTGAYSATIDDNFHNFVVTSSSGRNKYKVFTKGAEVWDTTPNWGIPATTSAVGLLYPSTANKETMYFAMWNRALSPTEVKALEVEPYQLLREKLPIVFPVGIAAAGVTVSPSPLHNVKDQYAAIMAHKLNGVLQ